MEKANISIVKDFIISILIVICIILVISVTFYNKISLSKVIPEAEEYVLTEDMEDDLKQAVLEENTQIVTTYHIDAADLKKYEQTKEYDKGKKNPFAAESTSENQNTTVATGNSVTEPSSNNSTNFYDDDGTK